MPQSFKLAIRGYHCDSYGHVNNARYLELLEEARWTALESNDLIKYFASLGLQFFIVNINISFKKAVMVHDNVEIRTSVHEVKRKTVTFLQQMYRGTELTTEAFITFVMFDVKTQRAASITPEIEDKFKTLDE